MGLFKKKIMYTSLPTDGDEERSTYFGESSLDELVTSKTSTTGACRLTVCKTIAFLLLLLVVFSGTRQNIPKLIIE